MIFGNKQRAIMFNTPPGDMMHPFTYGALDTYMTEYGVMYVSTYSA
jgi:hypothetical protein